LTHLAIKAKAALLGAVARMCCLPISAWSAGQPRRTRERKPVWVSVVLGVAESSTFCGPASGQPRNSHAFGQRKSVILYRVIHGRVGFVVTSGQHPPNRQASKCTKSPSFLHRAGRNRPLRCRHLWQRGRWQPHSTGPGLTPPSRGRLAASRKPPLTSNVMPHGVDRTPPSC
jgi:hypothetical protein